MTDEASIRALLNRAALAAYRALGHTHLNPLVGALLVKDGSVIGIGHHKRFGGLHAEREALADARARGHDPRGATLYCTLEPCVHHGKQPPCTEAVIESGIARVICARPDPDGVSGGGSDVLRRAGIPCAFADVSPFATRLSDPFVRRIETGRPWVVAKWAQTRTGRTKQGDSDDRWITGPTMRRRVHRMRAVVDAVAVGVRTANTDNPELTVRESAMRRVEQPKRVVFDTKGRLDHSTELVAGAPRVPTLVCTANAAAFRGTGVTVVECPLSGSRLDLDRALRILLDDHGIGTVLVEPGETLRSAMLAQDLVDDAFVHLSGPSRPGLKLPAELGSFGMIRIKRVGDDTELHYRRGSE